MTIIGKIKKTIGLWPLFSPVAIYLLIDWKIREYMRASLEGQGALHLFHVSTLWDVTIFLAFFVASSLGMLLFIYIYLHKRYIIVAIVCILCLAFELWGYSQSFGVIQKSGISYSSINTYFKPETIAWSMIDKKATLDITLKGGKGSYFQGVLNLSTNDGNLLPFEIDFNLRDEREYKSLINVINLLNENNIQVKTSIHSYISGPKREDEMLKLIKTLTEGDR